MYNLPKLPATVASNIIARGITCLTPVQNEILSLDDIAGDKLVSARTGSGKTLGYGMVFAQRLLAADGIMRQAPGPRALVIAPTREIATQVRAELAWLFSGTGARVGCCIGGSDIGLERAALLAGLDIVVGTPGRLRDHIERGRLQARHLVSVVLDEADEMLNFGFRTDLEAILAATPEDRQTLMFSATITSRIEALASCFQSNARRVMIAPEEERADMDFMAMAASAEDREKAVVNLLCLHEPKGALVFCNRRTTAAALTRYLAERGFRVVQLSGDLRQPERDAAVVAMSSARARVCVATDVAARGLDLPGLDLVIHAELPMSVETLLHRSGRTGRAGRKGRVAVIVPPRACHRAVALADKAGIALRWVSVPGLDQFEPLERERLSRDLRAGLGRSSSADNAATEMILAELSPREIASAYVKLWSASRPRMETLSCPEPSEVASADSGAWFSINFGNGQKNEVRRILPLLCRIGQINRQDIGKIRVMAGETRFMVRASALVRFAAAAAAHEGEPRLQRIAAADPRRERD